MPVTRTSLPGGAVVAVVKRCRDSRLAGAPRSSASRSTAGRHADAATVGNANTISRINTGLIDASNRTVTVSRRIQPAVENTDMYMWSSTKTWSRSTDSRSRYSGRSWWAMVDTDACNLATCDSSAIVTRSRKRRCTRVDTVDRNHVAIADRAKPTAASLILPVSPATTPSPRTLNHTARRASGSAATSDRMNATSINRGSCWYPSLHSRHIERSAGGRSWSVDGESSEDIEDHLLLAFFGPTDDETAAPQIEHGVGASPRRQPLPVRSPLHDLAAPHPPQTVRRP